MELVIIVVLVVAVGGIVFAVVALTRGVDVEMARPPAVKRTYRHVNECLDPTHPSYVFREEDERAIAHDQYVEHSLGLDPYNPYVDTRSH